MSQNLRFESLCGVLLTVGGATIYTVPAGYRACWKAWTVDNTDGAAPHTYTLAIVKSGLTIYVTQAANLTAATSDRKTDFTIVLNAGDTIVGAASAANFIHISCDGIVQKLVDFNT